MRVKGGEQGLEEDLDAGHDVAKLELQQLAGLQDRGVHSSK